MSSRQADPKQSPSPPSTTSSGGRWSLFGRGRKASAAPSEGRRSDFMIAATGLALGITCALFPWYIFFNQDKFGPPSVTFEGREDIEASGSAATATPLLPRDIDISNVRIVEIPDFKLDYAPTGSLRRTSIQPESAPAEQSYPGDISPFRVLHVTAGRAMIEDGSGIWVVQRGSLLPDNTKVEKIERRGSKWVVVTSADKVLDAGD